MKEGVKAYHTFNVLMYRINAYISGLSLSMITRSFVLNISNSMYQFVRNSMLPYFCIKSKYIKSC